MPLVLAVMLQGCGGQGAALVSVTIRFQYASCANMSCKWCAAPLCTVTKSVDPALFEDLRTTSLASCSVSRAASGGYEADCTGQCVETTPACFLNMPRTDIVITCPRIDGTADRPCEWNP